MPVVDGGLIFKSGGTNVVFLFIMKFVLEVKESKAAALMALLNDLPYVKTKPLMPYKAKVLEDVREAVDEMNQVLSGKIKARDADELLNGL
jgi:hypothetical protein